MSALSTLSLAVFQSHLFALTFSPLCPLTSRSTTALCPCGRVLLAVCLLPTCTLLLTPAHTLIHSQFDLSSAREWTCARRLSILQSSILILCFRLKLPSESSSLDCLSLWALLCTHIITLSLCVSLLTRALPLHGSTPLPIYRSLLHSPFPPSINFLYLFSALLSSLFLLLLLLLPHHHHLLPSHKLYYHLICQLCM